MIITVSVFLFAVITGAYIAARYDSFFGVLAFCTIVLAYCKITGAL